jgi:hypothetical protein
MKKSRITDEQIIGFRKQARLSDAVAPMQGDPGAVPAASPGRSNGAVSDSPRVTRFRGKMTPNSPRVIPGTRC